MPKPHVFITRETPEKGVNLLLEHCDIKIWHDEMPPSRDVLLKEITSCDGILTMLTDKIDGEVMDAAPNLKVISNFAVGYDNIDVAAATERGIPVGNTPGVLTDSSADHTWALLTAMARRIVEAEKYIKDGEWRTWHPLHLLGKDIHDATLGIIGFGRIGQAVARRAIGFNMRILYTGGSSADDVAEELGAEQVTLDELLEQSDFVSVHTPLNDETRHLISTRELELMKSDSMLINTSRGGTVDHEALNKALRTGEIGSAALDVTDPEPINLDSPLLELDNCLIVPHIASASRNTREKMGMIAAENLLAGLQGKKLVHCVNPEVQS